MDAIVGKLVIVVTDTGAGISASNQKKLFNEIIQFNPEKLQAGGGSGLGLWITSNIMDMHDGEISVASGGEGQGCSFTVKIPMLRFPSRQHPCLDAPILNRSHRSSLRNPIEEDNLPSACPSDSEVRAPLPTEISPAITRSPVASVAVSTTSSVAVSMITDTPSKPVAMRCLDVLVVDDSGLNRKMLIKYLKAADHSCEFAVDGIQVTLPLKILTPKPSPFHPFTFISPNPLTLPL